MFEDENIVRLKTETRVIPLPLDQVLSIYDDGGLASRDGRLWIRLRRRRSRQRYAVPSKRQIAVRMPSREGRERSLTLTLTSNHDSPAGVVVRVVPGRIDSM